MESKEREELKARLLKELTMHVGKSRAISMPRLYEKVFRRGYNDKISDTRELRRLITELRREGVPICSTTSKEGGGYYLASAGTELEEYLKKLRKRALRILVMEAKIRKVSLPTLIGQLEMELREAS